jgi:hypothetical protein
MQLHSRLREKRMLSKLRLIKQQLLPRRKLMLRQLKQPKMLKLLSRKRRH